MDENENFTVVDINFTKVKVKSDNLEGALSLDYTTTYKGSRDTEAINGAIDFLIANGTEVGAKKADLLYYFWDGATFTGVFSVYEKNTETLVNYVVEGIKRGIAMDYTNKGELTETAQGQ
jgi:hypothetical protein